MTTLSQICRIRSKNAGPFWITIDLFFHDDDLFRRYANAVALRSNAIARLFDVDPKDVKRFVVPGLAVVKFSYPRLIPQGGVLERDMHGGQQYIRLLAADV